MQYTLQFLLKELKGGKIIGNLAESYDVVTDPANPSITFHLRKGVKFHDGSDFNAQAVKWNFERTKAGGLVASATNFWKSFDVIDDYTLRVNLTNWFNRLIRGFADSVSFICSPTSFEKNGIEWARWNMVGTGPFKQVSYQRDVTLIVSRYDNYYEEGKPYLDKIQLLYVTDEMTRLALLKSGGAEVLSTLNPRYAAELQASGFNILQQPGGATVLVPDSANSDSPWSNLKVRQAAEYAIDKEAIARTFGYGYWMPAYQLNSPASMAYVEDLVPRKYDPAKAKQLLAEAGYPNGFKTKIIVSAGGNMDIPVSIQSYLSKVGINAEIEVKEPAAYQQILSGTWKNGLILNPLIEWANPNTGFNFFWGVPGSFFRSTSRPAGWAEAVLASNISPAPDPVLTQKLERMWYDDAMAIPVYYGVSLWAIVPNLRDSGIGTRGANTWWEPQNAWLSK
ncbi:MAG: ABC transporter substrate-binding protein [Dehalococcoidales bacterium]|jgi:peptide/nickel transport system substrate-binding protein|nr:ABC transporter substrate-binding protein [Dehalococcoidales bacterium]